MLLTINRIADFHSTILLPEGIYSGFQNYAPNIKSWIKDGSIAMFTENEYAVESAEVLTYNPLTKEQKFAFDFYRCMIPGLYFPDEIKVGQIKADESYSFLAFGFPTFPSPGNHDELIQAEILIRLGVVDFNGSPFIDYWVEPSLDEGLNTWLDDRKNGKALLGMGNVLLNAFHYVQTRMLREKQRIERFQTKEVERQTREAGDPAKKQTPRKIKIGCIQYQYLPVEDPERATRTFTRRAEAWSVRGHYRKYRSGKRVWIRPYTKGKGKIKATEYVVE